MVTYELQIVNSFGKWERFCVYPKLPDVLRRVNDFRRAGYKCRVLEIKELEI